MNSLQPNLDGLPLDRESVLQVSSAMLLICLICLLLAIPLHSHALTTAMFTRLTGLVFMTSLILSWNAFFLYLCSGLSVYCGNFQVTTVSVGIEELIFLLAGLYCLSLPSRNSQDLPREMPLILVFTTLGASLLVSSSNLISLTISLELQSLAVYVLATLNKGSTVSRESATFAGLMYFLLGALASCLVFLGCALAYAATGCLDFAQLLLLGEHLDQEAYQVANLGFIILIVALLFKVAAAPLHNWSIVVYDMLPTHLASWIAVLPKVSILAMIAILTATTVGSSAVLIMIAAVLSIAIGSILGLTQSRIKRLYAYSSVGHIGFLLLSLGAATNMTASLSAFVFYMVQYSTTTLALFLLLVALASSTNEIERISQLKGLYGSNPTLCITLSLCFFSMAGLPFLVGFFAKLETLTLCMESGYTITAIVAIVMSVVSAGYYLRVIQLSFGPGPSQGNILILQTAILAYVIAVISVGLLTYIVNPSLWMNLVHIMVLAT